MIPKICLVLGGVCLGIAVAFRSADMFVLYMAVVGMLNVGYGFTMMSLKVQPVNSPAKRQDIGLIPMLPAFRTVSKRNDQTTHAKNEHS